MNRLSIGAPGGVLRPQALAYFGQKVVAARQQIRFVAALYTATHATPLGERASVPDRLNGRSRSDREEVDRVDAALVGLGAGRRRHRGGVSSNRESKRTGHRFPTATAPPA